MKTLILAALLAIGTLPAAADLYVSPAGDDANPGTIRRPFQTLAAARNAIRAVRPSSNWNVSSQ